MWLDKEFAVDSGFFNQNNYNSRRQFELGLDLIIMKLLISEVSKLFSID